jgi:starvation-inducible DNA-binding protein
MYKRAIPAGNFGGIHRLLCFSGSATINGWPLARGDTVMPQLSLHTHKTAPLHTPTVLGTQATTEIAAALTGVLADTFALYLKTKNFHWHMSGPHFRDYHLMLDEQAEQIFAMTDALAERVRKVGGTTLRSIGQVARLQRLLDNDADYVTAQDMLAELAEDNRTLAGFLRAAHTVCDAYSDVASTSLLEVWIDETERRNWFLYESTRNMR